MLLVLLGTTGEIFHSTLTNITNTSADADRVDKLASRLSLHATYTQHTMQSILQSRRVIERSDPKKGPSLHLTGAKHLAQSEPATAASLTLQSVVFLSLQHHLKSNLSCYALHFYLSK